MIYVLTYKHNEKSEDFFLELDNPDRVSSIVQSLSESIAKARTYPDGTPKSTVEIGDVVISDIKWEDEITFTSLPLDEWLKPKLITINVS